MPITENLRAKRERKDTDIIIPFSWKDFESAIDILIEKLSPFDNMFDCIYGIPRGGLVLAVALSHRLNKPLVRKVRDSRTLVVDNIIDTGKTTEVLKSLEGFMGPVATIHYTGVPVKCNLLAFAYEKRGSEWVIYPWEEYLPSDEIAYQSGYDVGYETGYQQGYHFGLKERDND